MNRFFKKSLLWANKQKNIFSSFFLVIAMLSSVIMVSLSSLPFPTYAQKIDPGDIDDLQKVVDDLNKELDRQNKQLAEMEANKEKLEQSEAGYLAIVKELTERIAEVEQKQKDCEQALLEFKDQSIALQKKREEIKKSYLALLRILRERKEPSLLEIILTSESLPQLLSKLERAKDVSEYKSHYMDKLEESFAKIEEEQLTLEKELQEQIELGQQLIRIQEETKEKVEEANRQATAIAEEIFKAKGILANLAVQAEEGEKALVDLIRRYEAQLEQERLAKQTLLWPLDHYNVRITSPYGYRYDPITGAYRLHAGIDIAGPNSGDIFGNNIYASLDGTVIRTVNSNSNYSYGTYVLISHGGNEKYDGAISTLYAHMQYNSLTVKKGDTVKQGQIIGKVGSTGASNGPHLHYEVRINGLTTDPLKYDYIRYIDGPLVNPYHFITKGW